MTENEREAAWAFDRMIRAAEAAGLFTSRWKLHPGSPKSGVRWALTSGGDGWPGTLHGLPPFGHIGATASDATHYLTGMAAAFETVAVSRMEGAA